MTTALWSPDGRTLAFGSTAHQGSLLFPSLRLLDLSTGQITALVETSLAGFFWSPYGADLFYLSVDMQQNQLRWYRLDRTTGETTELVRFLPSREQALLFSFFDQYAYSHPLLAPDGNTLAFAGHLLETAGSDPSAPPHIYALPLTPPSTPQAIAPGTLACWDVASRPSSEEIDRKERRH
jgi:Tol biopolymer transport system component